MAVTVLVEAESFSDIGGWVVDQQFMDEMGSPFLLAHGIGKPVADATTAVDFPAAGTYRVWVRTRDWVGPWKTPDTPASKRAIGSPGIFRLGVNEHVLPTIFGVEGADWHWQDGGMIDIAAGTATLCLRDLTGFAGRCDAILFSTDHALIPPNKGEALKAFRRKLLGFPDAPEVAGEFDLIVTGGGIAGMCAAIAGARKNLRVAFIQDRPVYGGNNSSEVRVWLGGATNGERYPRIGDVVKELEPEGRAKHYGSENEAHLYDPEKRQALIADEPNLTAFPCYRVNEVTVADGHISGVTAENTLSGKRIHLKGRWFVDATGDGAVGFHAGADYEVTQQGHMGPSNLWGIDDTGEPNSFPHCSWAIDLSDKPFPGRGKLGDTLLPLKKRLAQLGCWYWECGFDHDPIRDREYMRDWNFRAMYGAWDCLKNTDRDFPTYHLKYSCYISGPRESRRLLGDIILAKDDLLNERDFADGCVVTGWSIDLHFPEEKYYTGFNGDGFISNATFGRYPMPFHVPYRCLYSRNIDNLFMAGRDISVTHEALGAVRVMRTCGLMGEVVGLAAAMCQERGCTPRDLHDKHLAEFKAAMQQGVPGTPCPA